VSVGRKSGGVVGIEEDPESGRHHVSGVRANRARILMVVARSKRGADNAAVFDRDR
jgi:hypothetical protein